MILGNPGSSTILREDNRRYSDRMSVGSREIVQAWGRILAGYRPNLSIEITRECPLRCPGCYAYGDDHLGGDVTLREVRDFKGQELVHGVMALVDRDIPRLSIVVSIDGLQPEHDVRRTPATYDRILKHIAGHRVTVHCTVTRQQVQRAGYIEEFLRFWSERTEVEKIWCSLYTPQIGEISDERLRPADRERVVADLLALRLRFPKLELPKGLIEVYATPPDSPDECVFARTTMTISADLTTRITPCQFGGNPDCSNCGCIASAGLAAMARHQLFGFIPVGSIFNGSLKLGQRMKRLRPAEASAG